MSLEERIALLAQAVGSDTGQQQRDLQLLFGATEPVRKLLEGAASFNAWINTSGKLALFQQLLASAAGLSYLVHNAAAMGSISASATAMSAVSSNASAMGAIASSNVAMGFIVADGPMQSIAPSSVAVAAISASVVAMSHVIQSQAALSRLSGSAEWNTFRGSKALIAFGGSLALTSDSAPGHATVSASSIYGAGYEAWRAFDDNATTRWGAAVAAASGARLNVTFALPHFVHTVRLTPHASDVYTAWVLECSDDGATWNTALSVPSYSAVGGVATEHAVAYPGRHRYWRVNFTTASGFAATGELQLDGWL